MRFDKHRFTTALQHIIRTHNEPLDQYDMVKIHVLVDFIHILEEGEPVIGGQPRVLPYGPVVQEAYDTVSRWISHGGEFNVVKPEGKTMLLAPAATTPDDWASALSLSEKRAVDEGWNQFRGMSFDESQQFFHNPNKYFGRVWSAHNQAWGTPFNWMEVVEAYEVIKKQDCSDAKAILAAPDDNELLDLAAAYPAPTEFWERGCAT